MAPMHHQSRRRAGFTLVEMMVSTALIIMIMYILASAFEKGMGTFRLLKAAGDMQEKLRTASALIRFDLSRPHFENSVPVSDVRPDKEDWYPHKETKRGYFRVDQAAPSTIIDGFDPDDVSLRHDRGLAPALT